MNFPSRRGRKISCRMKQFVILLLLASAAARAGEPLFLEKTMDAMGSTYSVSVYGEDADRMESAVEAAFDEVRRLDALLSNYRPASEWSAVNRNASDREYPVSGELFRLLAACYEYSRQSEGTFDITVGPLMRVWGFYKGSGRLPHRAEVRGALARVGYRKLRLDAARQVVRFDVPGMELDPGGIGKGYTVDRMVEILKKHGVGAALISAGGSSIYALGAPPRERGWRIKLRHPRDSAVVVDEAVLKDESMSTSGNYEKFFRAEGRIYSHIMDPRTGFPAQGVLSASVIAPRALDSEAWTKPYFIQGRQWAAKHKPENFRVYLCEDRSELACAWLQ